MFEEAPVSLLELKEYIVRQVDHFGGMSTKELTKTLREQSTYNRTLVRQAYKELVKEGTVRKMNHVDGSSRLIVPYIVY